MSSGIDVPEHLKDCRRCRGLYKLLVSAYAPDRGVGYDEEELDQGDLCDHCGVTSCGLDGCECWDVLCPHGRNNLRAVCAKGGS
jgi:hypothetical protein